MNQDLISQHNKTDRQYSKAPHWTALLPHCFSQLRAVIVFNILYLHPHKYNICIAIHLSNDVSPPHQ